MKYLPLISLFFAGSALAQDNTENHGRWTADQIKKSCYMQANEPGGQGAREFDRCMRLNYWKVGKDKSPADIDRLNRADAFLTAPEEAPPTPKKPQTPQMF